MLPGGVVDVQGKISACLAGAHRDGDGTLGRVIEVPVDGEDIQERRRNCLADRAGRRWTEGKGRSEERGVRS